MTSGLFKSFPVARVWVNREERQRREIVEDPELTDSIRRAGLIHPLVIKQDGELITGERRLLSIKALGWTDVPIQFVDDLSEDELKVIELEENVRRKDIEWKDRCLAAKKYHELRKAQNPDWNVTQTAEALGYEYSTIYNQIKVAEELEGGNKRVLAAPKFSTANNIIRRETERRRTSAIMDEIAPVNEEDIPILTVDFLEWSQTYDGPPFNLIHCDFPYGVNADKHDQGAAASQGGYEDSAETYFNLIDLLGDVSESKMVQETAHLIFWFSMDYYETTRIRLTDRGWKVNPFPLIWFKSDNTGILPDPHRGPRRVYETAFLASRGDRKIVQAVSNCYPAPVTKEHHMSEKSLPMLTHFFRMVCDEYSSVLDPTCGSGNALIAAKRLGAGSVLGLERDPEFAERARGNWRQAKAGDAAS